MPISRIPRGAPVGYNNWRDSHGGASISEYNAWLQQNGLTPQSYVDLFRQPGGLPPNLLTNPLNSQPYPVPPNNSIPVPGQPLPQPTAPPNTPIPGPGSGGPPAFAPPQVQMPQMLPAAAPQGLGGMPLIRDRMMASTMDPMSRPNWGIPQVPAEYLTQQMPLPGGSTAGIGARPMPMGMSNPQQSLPYAGLGNMQFPRRMFGGSVA